MSIEKIPPGSRGGKFPRAAKWFMPILMWMHRRSGDRSQGMDILYLTTTGAKSGQRRTNPVARFEDGGGWVVVASAGGARNHPAWYHNIVAHPDQVEAELAGRRFPVTVTQLEGAERDRVWARVTSELPRFSGYTEKTDREFPILRLTPHT
jgi:deazaflavin-dependent oxidoreductase (nitroreductase family)